MQPANARLGCRTTCKSNSLTRRQPLALACIRAKERKRCVRTLARASHARFACRDPLRASELGCQLGSLGWDWEACWSVWTKQSRCRLARPSIIALSRWVSCSRIKDSGRHMCGLAFTCDSSWVSQATGNNKSRSGACAAGHAWCFAVSELPATYEAATGESISSDRSPVSRQSSPACSHHYFPLGLQASEDNTADLPVLKDASEQNYQQQI